MLTFTLAFLFSCNLLFYLDDLFLEAALRWWASRHPVPAAPARFLRLAVLIPFWRDNTSFLACPYPHATVFLGVHAGDVESWKAARALEQTHPHVVLLVHPEGLSRAEARAHMAKQVLAAEPATGLTFEGFVLLEGSDALHPEALRLFSAELQAADLVQLPVVPTLTNQASWGAGAYADEATELSRELQLRARLGVFVPCHGTGAAVSPALLRALLRDCPRALSEGYALGAEAQRLGFAARYAMERAGFGFVGVQRRGPESFRWALKRRARLARESAVNGYRAYGWGRSLKEFYFLWRDRRLMAFTLLGFVGSLAFLALSITGRTAETNLPLWIGYFWLGNAALAILRLWFRMRACRASHGWGRALTLPLRWPASNLLLSLAHWRALAARADS